MEQVGLDNEPSDQDTYLPIGNIIGRRIYDEGRQKKTSFNGRISNAQKRRLLYCYNELNYLFTLL